MFKWFLIENKVKKSILKCLHCSITQVFLILHIHKRVLYTYEPIAEHPVEQTRTHEKFTDEHVHSAPVVDFDGNRE